jgi:hypothetical protein
MKDVDILRPETGRELREDGTYINTADLLVGMLDKSGGVRHVSELQNAVHDGMAFGFSSHGTLGAGLSLIMLGVTGTFQVHFDGFLCDISQGPFLLELYEAPTVITLGTQQSSRRRNRSNPNVSKMLIYAGGTVSANGLLISDDLLLGIGQGSNVVNGTAGLDDGFVLKANTTYMIKLTNQAASTTSYNAKFAWHEATYTV